MKQSKQNFAICISDPTTNTQQAYVIFEVYKREMRIYWFMIVYSFVFGNVLTGKQFSIEFLAFKANDASQIHLE